MASRVATATETALVTIDEWISYYEDISSSIDEDDLFGTMLASTWSSLTTKNPEGETVPAIQCM